MLADQNSRVCAAESPSGPSDDAPPAGDWHEQQAIAGSRKVAIISRHRAGRTRDVVEQRRAWKIKPAVSELDVDPATTDS
jgi:hypothetical protein